MPRICRVAGIEIGPGRPLVIIAGPCVLESPNLGLEVGSALSDVCRRVGLPYIFKASFDKANRTSVHSPRGPGLKLGLQWLSTIGESLGAPLTTDIHEPTQAAPAVEVIDLLQIPAFLCRQTDLLHAAGSAAAAAHRAVNVKKGQFLSPREMAGPIRKLREAGCDQVLCTDRGTFFGYHRLVNDFTGLGELMDLDVPGGPPPVCFDCTHSTQLPGLGEQSGGLRRYSPLLARAAVAAGVHALFLECHPDPSKAMSDSATQLSIPEATTVIEQAARLRAAVS